MGSRDGGGTDDAVRKKVWGFAGEWEGRGAFSSLLLLGVADDGQTSNHVVATKLSNTNPRDVRPPSFSLPALTQT